MSEQTLSPVPLSASDVEVLTVHKGLFAQGHADDDINAVLAEFTGARLVCVWDYHDEWGFGGNSEIIGRPITATGQGGEWRRLSSEVTEFLYDPESDLDPESIASLLDTEGTFAIYETQDIDALDGDDKHNVTLDPKVPVAKQ
jgi:hypothetical protein